MKITFLAVLIVLFFNIFSYELPLLIIKIPTRSRPERFFKMLDIYYGKLSGEIPYYFLISCDEDDLTMNCTNIIERLKKYPNLSLFFGNNKTKTEAYNADIDKIKNWDIVLVASDDLKPEVKNYDKIVVESMLKHFPDFDGVLNFNDGHVLELNTYPVIGRRFYNRFGYIYNPIYTSLCTDSELTTVSRLLHKEVIIDNILLRHMHPIWQLAQWDDLYRRNESFLEQDAKIFLDRAARNFDLAI